MSTEQLPVTDHAAAGAHTYPTATPVVEVVFDDQMTDASLWHNFGGKTNEQVFDDPAAEDGKAIGANDGETRLIRNDILIPYDGTSLYEVSFTVRTVTETTTAGSICWCGFAGVAADQTTLVNTSGADSGSNQHFVALKNHPVYQSDTYTTYIGYLQGWGAAGTYAETPSPAEPGVLHELGMYVRPLMTLNWQATDGEIIVDRVTIRRATAPAAATDYPITVTGDTTGKKATTQVTITNTLDTTGSLSAAAAGLQATATIDGLTSDTSALVYWGDQTPHETVTLTAGTGTATHTYAEAGPALRRVRAEATYTVSALGDVTGTVLSDIITVTSPVLTVTQVQDLDVSAAVEDMTGDTTVTVDWGDSNTSPGDLVDGAATLTYTYADDSGSPYTVTVTGDQSGGTATDTVDVTDPPPMHLAVDTAGDPQITATLTNAPADAATVTFDYGDDSSQDTVTITDGTAAATHTYATNGTYTVHGVESGHNNNVAMDANIRHAADGLTVTVDTSADPNANAKIKGIDYSDSTVTIDWGDGSTDPGERTLDGTLGPLSHTYAANGDYTVTVTGDTSGQTAPAAVTIAGAAA